MFQSGAAPVLYGTVRMSERRVVVTGYGVQSCVGCDVPTFWDSLVNGRCGLGRITFFDPQEFRTQIAGEIRDFDPEKYMTVKEDFQNSCF